MTPELTPAVLAGWRRAAEIEVQVDPFGARGMQGRRTLALIDALIESRGDSLGELGS